jgi:RIO kinase 2
VGTRIGVGKESDIMIVADNDGTQKVLKIHRLGRISFRTVKANRDYLRKQRGAQGQGGSWMYLSRLAAMKEYAFMQALREEGFAVPEPIMQSRHTILMSLVDAYAMRQVAEVGDPAALYGELIDMILRLAKHGLIHGDFNEFNILLKEERTPSFPDNTTEGDEEGADAETIKVTPILIDFPQIVSTQPGPFFKDAKKTVGRDGVRRLDAAVEASGFTKKMLKDLEAAIREQQAERPEDGEEGFYNENDAEEDENEDEEKDEEADEETEAAEVEKDLSADRSGDVEQKIDLSSLSLKEHT